MTGPVYEAPELHSPEIKAISRGERLRERREGAVAVPAAFYKIVYDPRRRRVIAFVLPNKNLKGHEIDEYLTSVDEIEALTGLDFFPRLSRRRERQLERVVSNAVWRH